MPIPFSFDVVTLFPEMFQAVTHYGITGRAWKNKIFELITWNPRDFSRDPHRTVDDSPYGGGPGMVMMAEPLDEAITQAKTRKRANNAPTQVVYLSPQGEKLTHAIVKELSVNSNLIFLCGRYEGIDERLIDRQVDREISIGDYVLSGGEIAAMVLIDAIVRQIPGALGDPESANQDSFVNGLLDCPHYTRPEVYKADRVPEILMSGNHSHIKRWRLQQSLGRTWLRRPDLLATKLASGITHEEQKLLEEYQQLQKNWDTFINDIKLVSTNSLQKSIELTRLLSAADSPLLTLLQAITKEITLINTDPTEKDIVEKATDKVKNAKTKLEQYLGKVNEKTPTTVLRSRPEEIVDGKFKDLRRLVQASKAGQSAPIDQLLSKINELYYFLTATEEALNTNTALPASKVQTEMRTEARQLNEPLRTMFVTLSSSSQNQTEGMTRGNLNQSLKIAVTDFCLQATSGRYPFVKKSSQDVTQDDFAQLFSFGGRFDEYFQKELAQLVDNTKQAWHFRQTGNAPRDLQEFKHAQTIRDIFFRGGARVTNINFTFKPVDMDPSITQFILDIDGQLIKYSHGPQVPISVQWPGPKGSTQVRLQISPAPQDGVSGQVFEGPWALFRMFDNVQITSSPQSEKFFATFNVNGRKAQFEVTTSSVQNPFRLKELQDFKCPSKL